MYMLPLDAYRGEMSIGNASDSSTGTAPLFCKFICACCETSWEAPSSYSKPPDLKRLEEIAIEHLSRRILRSDEIQVTDRITAHDISRCSQILGAVVLCDSCINFMVESEKRILKLQKDFLDKMKGTRDFSEVLADPWFDLKKFAFHKLKPIETVIINKLTVVNQHVPTTLAPISVTIDNGSGVSATNTTSSGLILTGASSSSTLVEPKIFVAPNDFKISDSERSNNAGEGPPTCQFATTSDASQANSPVDSSHEVNSANVNNADNSEMETNAILVPPSTSSNISTSVGQKRPVQYLREVVSSYEGDEGGHDTDCTTRSEPVIAPRYSLRLGTPTPGCSKDLQNTEIASSMKSGSPSPKRSKVQQSNQPMPTVPKPQPPPSLYIARKSAPVRNASPKKPLTSTPKDKPANKSNKRTPSRTRKNATATATVTMPTPPTPTTAATSSQTPIPSLQNVNVVNCSLDTGLKVVASTSASTNASASANTITNTSTCSGLFKKREPRPPKRFYTIGSRVIPDSSSTSSDEN